MRFHEVAGNLHVHTLYSDGTGLHREVVQAAQQAGLDFVIATDHNVWVEGVEGVYDGVLLLVGEEVHQVYRDTPANHLLVYAAETELAPVGDDPQRLIEEANRQGGMCFLAHPSARNAGISSRLISAPWVDWDVTGYLGLEIWNVMSEFKGLLQDPLSALVYTLWPGVGLKGPLQATLRRWDQLLVDGHKVTAIGGSDAHARLIEGGPARRVVFSYQDLFRWVNTHLLLERPLVHELEKDKALIYDALRAGRTWVGYDRLSSTRDFRFQARSGANSASIGEELVRAGAIIFEATLPAHGDMRLICNGKPVARARGTALRFTTAEPGNYRLEVYRRFRGRQRGWIFSSPVYVR